MSKRLNMSNDEAVEWLLSLKNLDICGENRKTAIDKAIQALEAQPFINKPCVSEGVCREDKMQVLEKIRAEIFKEVINYSGTGEEVIQAYADGLKKGLDIIDKYKSESEDEADDKRNNNQIGS